MATANEEIGIDELLIMKTNISMRLKYIKIISILLIEI